MSVGEEVESDRYLIQVEGVKTVSDMSGGHVTTNDTALNSRYAFNATYCLELSVYLVANVYFTLLGYSSITTIGLKKFRTNIEAYVLLKWEQKSYIVVKTSHEINNINLK